MKKLMVFSLVCLLSGFSMIACQRDQNVQAGYEPGRSDTYQPRRAPKGEVEQNPEMQGELLKVDLPGKTISIRAPNGMEQTFKFDDNTVLSGIEIPVEANAPKLRALAGKEGSEIHVDWRDDNGIKVASNVNVIHLNTSKAIKKARTKGTSH